MKYLKNLALLFLLVSVGAFLLNACGDNTAQDPSKFSNTKKVENTSGLSDFELENGIGPIKQKIELGPIDPALVKKGQEILIQNARPATSWMKSMLALLSVMYLKEEVQSTF